MLETRDLTIRFGGHVAVDHVSCRFEAGTLTAIVGPNGAGKTTLFNLISGQLPASEGRVLLAGEDITRLPAPLRTRRGLGRAFQLTQLFPNLTVQENVRLTVQAREQGRGKAGLDLLRVWLDRREWIDESQRLLEAVRLADKRDAVAASLPHGDQRKLEVALLMALDPKVYMFDEPTAGMSVDEVPVVLELIRALKARRDRLILLVEHKMDVVRELADRIVVLHNGQLVADGEPAAVIASPWCSRPTSACLTPRQALGPPLTAPLPGPCPPSGEAPSMSDALLTLQGVHTHIGAYHILHGVDLEVPAGEVTMLLGRNGAGKSTTLRTIMGLWRASQGRIAFKGRALQAMRTPDIAQAGIGYVPETMGIFSDLTVKENLLLAARQARRAADLDAQRLDWIFGLFPALKKFWLFPAGKLSGGQKQMLAIARAIVEPRALLLIDEPSKGLAPAIVNNLIAALRELKAQAATILLVEQNFQMARALGDSVAVMDDGRVVHRGRMQALADDEALQQRLLGLSLAVHQ